MPTDDDDLAFTRVRKQTDAIMYEARMIATLAVVHWGTGDFKFIDDMEDESDRTLAERLLKEHGDLINELSEMTIDIVTKYLLQTVTRGLSIEAKVAAMPDHMIESMLVDQPELFARLKEESCEDPRCDMHGEGGLLDRVEQARAQRKPGEMGYH